MTDKIQTFVKKVLPQPRTLVLFHFLSAVLLAAVNYRLVLPRLLNNLPITSSETESMFQSYASYFGQFGQSQAAHVMVVVLLWSGAGILAYLLLWVVLNVLIEFKNFIVYEMSYVHKSHLIDRFKDVSKRLLLAVMVIAVTVVTIVYGLPLWLNLFTDAMFTPAPGLIALLAAAIAGLALNLYLLWAFIKLFLLANASGI